MEGRTITISNILTKEEVKKENEKMLSLMNVVIGERERKMEKKRDIKFKSKQDHRMQHFEKSMKSSNNGSQSKHTAANGPQETKKQENDSKGLGPTLVE